MADEDAVTEAVQAALAEAQQAHDADIQGLKSQNSELIGELRDARKALKTWEGLDPDDVKTTLAQVRENKEMALLKDGKFEEAYGERLKVVQKENEALLTGRDEQIQKLTDELAQTQAAYSSKLIDDEVLRYFVEAGGRKEAVDDVLLRAQRTFRIHEGAAVAYDGDTPLADENGLVGPSQWIAALQKKAPHLWPDSQGAGATGAAAQRDDLSEGSELARAVASGDMAAFRKLREGKK